MKNEILKQLSEIINENFKYPFCPSELVTCEFIEDEEKFYLSIGNRDIVIDCENEYKMIVCDSGTFINGGWEFKKPD